MLTFPKGIHDWLRFFACDTRLVIGEPDEDYEYRHEG